MSRELFEKFNDQANYNLGVRGNLSNVVLAYKDLAKSMGKEDVALEQIASLPPASALENPDYRLDEIKTIYGIEQPEVVQTMTR